jgi:hypothetical protein
VKKLPVYLIDGENPLILTFSEVKKIFVYKKTRELQGSEKREIIELLGLELQHSAGQIATILEFYNEERFPDLTGEILLAENWTKLIN